MNILTEKQTDRTDSFFYSEPIAELTAKDGTVFTSYPLGDVDYTINGIEYVNGRRFGTDGFDELTDNSFNEEIGTSQEYGDSYECRNNNWFAVTAEKENQSYWDFDTVDFDYDSAINTLENTVGQYDNKELELQ